MNFRVSFILLVLLAVVGGYVLFFELQREPKVEPQPPFFYNVQEQDITGVSVTYQGQRLAFAQKDNQWVFEDSGAPVDPNRWSGIPLLLSGPRAASVLLPQLSNAAEYGLDPPETTIAITISGGQEIDVLLGFKTPDGLSNYAQVVGFQSLLLVSASWGDVMNRLVTEPPVVTPAATPGPTQQ